MKTGNLSIKKFHEIRNNILFISDWGGLGDVIIHRMCFADVKKIIPEAKIHFCCLKQYFDIIIDHPMVDCLIEPDKLNKNDYLVFYQTDVKISNKYESHYGKKCNLNRSDIWALSCGYKIEDHDMYFKLDQGVISSYKNKLDNLKKNKEKPSIIFCPESAIKTKCLLPHQIDFIDDILSEYNVFLLAKNIEKYKKYKFQSLGNTSIKDLMYYIASCDYVISVDSAPFHLAGGMRKPLLGIFTFANGKTYGKYYDFVLVQKHYENGNWECGPCYNYRSCSKTNSEIKPCLQEIGNDEIENGINSLFYKWPILNKNHHNN